jgi:hypothetical protein
MQIGITPFIENTPDPATGKWLRLHEWMMNMVEETGLSDQLGLDVISIGEQLR